MTFWKLVSLSAATLVLGLSPAFAQLTSFEDLDQSQPVELLNEVTVLSALSTVTQTRITTVDQQGNAYLIATAPNGLRFEVRFRACDGGTDDGQPGADASRHCKGMIITSAWGAIPAENRGDMQSLADAFQQADPTISAGMLADGSPYLIRYVIADYGTLQGNLVSEFANFIRSGTEFQNAIVPLYETE